MSQEQLADQVVSTSEEKHKMSVELEALNKARLISEFRSNTHHRWHAILLTVLKLWVGILNRKS